MTLNSILLAELLPFDDYFCVPFLIVYGIHYSVLLFYLSIFPLSKMHFVFQILIGLRYTKLEINALIVGLGIGLLLNLNFHSK